MKKLLLILTTFFAVCCHAQTDVYHPFLHENASWSTVTKRWDEFSIDTFFTYTPIFVDGDTIFEDQSYIKIKIFEDCAGCFRALMREDLGERKVYVNYFEASGDTLLYDFSLEVGDSASHCYTFAHFDSSRVIQVDSILIGDNYRKKFIIACHLDGISDTTFWIEGVGGIFGPAPQEGPQNFGYGYLEYDYTKRNYLVCYKENEVALYQEPYYQIIFGGDSIEYTCDYVLPIEEHPIETSLVLFPNPVSGNQLHTTIGGYNQCLIFSATGQRMDINHEATERTIQFDNLPAGLYTITFVFDEQQTITKHFIKL